MVGEKRQNADEESTLPVCLSFSINPDFNSIQISVQFEAIYGRGDSFSGLVFQLEDSGHGQTNTFPSTILIRKKSTFTTLTIISIEIKIKANT